MGARLGRGSETTSCPQFSWRQAPCYHHEDKDNLGVYATFSPSTITGQYAHPPAPRQRKFCQRGICPWEGIRSVHYDMVREPGMGRIFLQLQYELGGILWTHSSFATELHCLYLRRL